MVWLEYHVLELTLLTIGSRLPTFLKWEMMAFSTESLSHLKLLEEDLGFASRKSTLL